MSATICKNCVHCRSQVSGAYPISTFEPVFWCAALSPKGKRDFVTGEPLYKKHLLCRKLNKEGKCEHFRVITPPTSKGTLQKGQDGG